MKFFENFEFTKKREKIERKKYQRGRERNKKENRNITQNKKKGQPSLAPLCELVTISRSRRQIGFSRLHGHENNWAGFPMPHFERSMYVIWRFSFVIDERTKL